MIRDDNLKIITVCGSLKFKEQIMEVAEKMQLLGNCVLTPVYPTRVDLGSYTPQEIEILGKMHKEKIKLSDAILVVNVDNYIGSSTQKEIELAKSLNKEIIYFTDLEF